MITEARVKAVKYPPERIPDGWLGNVPLTAEVAPAILDLRRFKPFFTILTDIQLVANANVLIRLRYGASSVFAEESTAADLSGRRGAWFLPAKDYLYYNLFGLAAVANYATHFSVWSFLPTVAHKLLYDITLTEEDRALAEKLGIFNSVEKGILPLPISLQIEREYPVMGEETHSRSVNIAVAGTVYTIESLYPRTDEIIVLTRLASAPGTVAQNVQLVVDRDDDAGYASFPTFPLSLIIGGEVQCFVPALREIRLTTSATVAPGAHLFRYTFQRIKLTNLLRVRFGLVTKDEVPGDLWDKVKGGVL